MTAPSLYRRAFSERYGLPELDWSLVNDELGETAGRWDGFLDEWLSDLAERLEPETRLVEHGMVRCLYNDQVCQKPLPRIASEIRERVYGLLVSDPEHLEWPSVVVHIGSRERYYDYISLGDVGEGEEIASAGCMINHGYLHIAIGPAQPWFIEPLLAHEFVHLALCYLPTPLWLEEGLAEMIPEVVLGRGLFRIDRELVSRHREHWTKETIQAFWDGTAFHAPETSELAYSLAEILVQNLGRDHAGALRGFIAEADRNDGGDAAARMHLGVGLSEIMSGFLGDGDWDPEPV